METARSTENSSSLDTLCTCQLCGHGLARDCHKVGRTCCEDYNHFMILDRMEGFPPTR